MNTVTPTLRTWKFEVSELLVSCWGLRVSSKYMSISCHAPTSRYAPFQVIKETRCKVYKSLDFLLPRFFINNSYTVPQRLGKWSMFSAFVKPFQYYCMCVATVFEIEKIRLHVWLLVNWPKTVNQRAAISLKRHTSMHTSNTCISKQDTRAFMCLGYQRLEVQLPTSFFQRNQHLASARRCGQGLGGHISRSRLYFFLLVHFLLQRYRKRQKYQHMVVIPVEKIH
jgi:hypothetical protein